MVKKGGRVLQFGGMPKGNSKPGIDMNLVHYKGLHIIGTTAFAPIDFITAVSLLESGAVQVKDLVSHVFPLEDFAEGARLAMEGKVLKAVFTMNRS